MKRIIIMILALAVAASLAACNVTITPAPGVSGAASASPGLTPTAAPPPTSTPTATPTPFGEEPDHAGSGDVLFDIYQSEALVDLNFDGTPGADSLHGRGGFLTLTINGNTFTIDRDRQAQLFAVTDVDISDGTLELAFTDEYSDDLADTEFPFTYLYWWNGTKLINMGGLMDMKFDGAWRAALQPGGQLRRARNRVMCLTRTQNFTDIWYTGHYVPDGADRKLKEELYKATPLFHPAPSERQELHTAAEKYRQHVFRTSYDVIWDYASMCGGYADKPRDYSDSIVAFIPQAGETLTVCAVYGKMWFKLKAADGKQGWLKCKDMKVYGYWPLMGADYTADNLFDGIIVAG